nr:hypothetical protein [Candidatus Sigynarchaeum springense]
MTEKRIYLDIKNASMLATICDRLGYSRADAIHKAIQDLYDAVMYTPPTTCDICGLVSKTDIARFKDDVNRCPACAGIWREKMKEVVIKT